MEKKIIIKRNFLAHNSQGQHGAQTPTSPPAQNTDLNMVSGNSTRHRPHCGFLLAAVRSRTPARPLAMAQTTVTSMASGSSMNHGGLSRRLNPEDEPFFILGLLLLGATIIVHLDNTFQGRTCTISRLLARHCRPCLATTCCFVHQDCSPVPDTVAMVLLLFLPTEHGFALSSFLPIL